MNRRKLGRSGIDVSEVSFGTVSLGIPYGIGVTQDNMISEKDSIALLNSALDQGVNFFDTARSYGTSEIIVGKALKSRRDQAVICTKPAHIYDPHSGETMPSDREVKRILEESFEENLSRLQTDYVDVLMSHEGSAEVIGNDTVIEFYQSLKKKGSIRATGISTYTVEQSRQAIESGVWDVIQLPFNLMDQTQGEVFRLAEENGVGIVVRSVLFKGILTDRGGSLHPELGKVQRQRELYKQLLTDEISTLSDLASKFVLSHKKVASILVGIDKPEYLQSALTVADGHYLDEESLNQAGRMAYPEPEFLDLPRWDRKGWLI